MRSEPTTIATCSSRSTRDGSCLRQQAGDRPLGRSKQIVKHYRSCRSVGVPSSSAVSVSWPVLVAIARAIFCRRHYSRDGRTFAEAAERRARQIGRLFRRPQPQTNDAFSSTFLARLSLSNVNSVIKDLVTRYGAGRRTSAITRLPSGQISFRVELSSGHSVPVRMRINSAAPHRIEALLFENPIPASPTFTALAAEMRELPGRRRSSSLALLADAQILRSSIRLKRSRSDSRSSSTCLPS